MIGESNGGNIPMKIIDAVKILNNQLKVKDKCHNHDNSIIVYGNPSHYEKAFAKNRLGELRRKINDNDTQKFYIKIVYLKYTPKR